MPGFARAVGRRLPFSADMLIFLLLLLGAGAVGGPARTLLPVYLTTDLDWTPPTVAALSALRLLAGAVTAPIGGALADTLGARPILWLGLTGLPIASLAFCTGLSPALVALILMAGLADGWQSTGSQAYLVTRARASVIGLATSVYFVSSTLGGAVGNLAAGALLGLGGFMAVGLAGLVASGPVLLGLAWLPARRPGRRWTPPLPTPDHRRRGSPAGAPGHARSDAAAPGLDRRLGNGLAALATAARPAGRRGAGGTLWGG